MVVMMTILKTMLMNFIRLMIKMFMLPVSRQRYVNDLMRLKIRERWCVDCKNCPECKWCERLGAVSIQEEVEQSLIDCSVKVDVESCTTTAKLPFLVDPDFRMISNERQAMKVYQNQI